MFMRPLFTYNRFGVFTNYIMRIFQNYLLVTTISLFSFLMASLILTPSDTIARESSAQSTTISNKALKNQDDQPPDKVIKTSSESPQTSTGDTQTEECPVSLIFEGDQQQQDLLRDFRDEVLAQHDKGIDYIKSYYLHSPEITLIILTDDDIRLHTHRIFLAIFPIASALIKTGEAQLSEHLLDDADKLLNEIAHKASSSLRETIKLAKSDIIKKEIFEELNIKIIK